MQKLIEGKRRQIEDLCRRHHVLRLSVFGSSVREDFNPERSDVDLLVEFDSLSELEYAPNYFALLDAFEELFMRHVDLISADSVRNPYLKREIENDKKLLYAA